MVQGSQGLLWGCRGLPCSALSKPQPPSSPLLWWQAGPLAAEGLVAESRVVYGWQ